VGYSKPIVDLQGCRWCIVHDGQERLYVQLDLDLDPGQVEGLDIQSELGTAYKGCLTWEQHCVLSQK
jgi:hypothetical protein